MSPAGGAVATAEVATPPDAPRIEWLGDARMHLRTLADWHVRAFADRVDAGLIAEAERELGRHAQRRALPTTLVALEGDALLGSVSLLDRDRPAPDHYAPWLGTLYVRPEARRRGIGARLVQAAVAEACRLGIGSLRLWTPRHAAFYARLGWRSLGRHQFGGIAVTLMQFDRTALPVVLPPAGRR
jgi:predicted N-acetyltransferase YhbS